jgi:hypothetical protein
MPYTVAKEKSYYLQNKLFMYYINVVDKCIDFFIFGANMLSNNSKEWCVERRNGY